MAGGSSNTFSDLFAELAQLGREASLLDSRLRTAAASVVESSGRDPSGQVRVVLTAAGRIHTAEVAPGWRSHLTANSLGTAVLAAYQEAGKRRIETWAAEVGRTKNEVVSPDEIARETSNLPLSSTDPTNGPAVDTDSIRGLWYLLQDATDRFDTLALEATARSQKATTGRDSTGHVTATLTGEELSGLDLDQRWADRAGGQEIGTAITSAIADGYATIDRLAERSLTRQWPFPDLDRITSDPAALLTALGLPVPHTDDDQRR
ncbi:hypothetical protein Ato02nite_093290 [Paractinoplanes toevensis]|uniref:YbaB/EbfC DNA-binding family protein n=1 Tax=Paractinoplanes toevensis TaxID=571911 RepID=A0A919WCA8_9ACTN|nr:hypothetical protein Ato02nite_093290 [Actinoplanes toevensis]